MYVQKQVYTQKRDNIFPQGNKTMKVYQIPQDYRHIERYGQLNNWSSDFVKGQQFLAHRMNAPFDTVEVTQDGAVVRFEYLLKEMRKMFGDVK